MDNKQKIRSELGKIAFAHSCIAEILDTYVCDIEVVSKYTGQHQKDGGTWYSVGEGMWDCEESPVGICVYHKINDPVHDNCIFCHEPEERK